MVFIFGICLLQEEEETPINKDPFNLSNDEYYNPKMANDAALKSNLGAALMQVQIDYSSTFSYSLYNQSDVCLSDERKLILYLIKSGQKASNLDFDFKVTDFCVAALLNLHWGLQHIFIRVNFCCI